jgi:hypothetical protein
MKSIYDNLIQRGRQRGYLTYAEVNEAIPQSLTWTAEDIDAFLAILERQGIELLEEEPGPGDLQDTDPIETPPVERYYRDAQLEQTLRDAGIPFTDLICRRETSGKRFEARLIVPGTEALPSWWKLRGLVPVLGHWPVIVPPQRPDAALFFVLLEDDHPDAATDAVSDPQQDHGRAAQLLASALHVAPDPRTFHRWHSSGLETLSEAAWQQACRQQPGPAILPLPAERYFLGDKTPFRGHRDIRTEVPMLFVEIHLTPTAIPWQVFAYRPFGGWNGAPNPEEQLAMQHSWYDRFGAEIVSMCGDWYEMFVARPPRTRAAALTLAREMSGFGEETIFGYADRTIDELIHTVQGSRYWYFWWD